MVLPLGMLALLVGACGRAAPTGTPAPAPIGSPTPTGVPPTGMPSTDGQGFTIYFIDVGQGDATLVVDRSGASLLVDGGRSGRRIRDRLQRLGVKDLDSIAMTHPDSDHIGGLPQVLEMYPIEHIYLNGGQSDTQIFAQLTTGVTAEGAAVTTVSRGDVIPLGGLQLQVLHPGGLTGESNADSLVLLVSCAGIDGFNGDVSVLLAADAEAESEAAMLAAGVLGDVDVLKVGHHGSRTSTTAEFLARVKPEVGVISAGQANSYGHPHPEVVERLEATNVQLFTTDTTNADNTLALTSDCRSYQFQPATALGR